VTSFCDLNLIATYNSLFDDVATQIRWFYVIWFRQRFCDAANCGPQVLPRWRALPH
jgi:hypothetical protein